MNKTSKFKKALSVVLVMMMMLSCLTIMPLTASAAGGTGTADDPYKVSTKAELETALASASTARYIELTADIDLGGSWTPASYAGEIHLNGNGHTITGLVASGWNAGFFATLNNNSSVSNLTFVAPKVSGSGQCGVVVAQAKGNVTISNVSILDGADQPATVTCSSNHAGAIVGSFYGNTLDGTPTATIINCYNEADITSGTNAGGIIGNFQLKCNLNVSYCVNVGNVKTTKTDANTVGGIIGLLNGGVGCKGNISFCVNKGTVTNGYNGENANKGTGGIVGYQWGAMNDGTLHYSDCYNVGELIAGKNGWAQLGGITGLTNGYDAANVDAANTKTYTRCYDYSKRSTTDAGITAYGDQGGITGWGESTQLLRTYTDCYAANHKDSKIPYGKVVNQLGGATMNNTAYFTEDATHTIENVEIALSTTGEATTIAAEMARIDNAIAVLRYNLDISAGSANLSARLKLTDPHGFMVITDVESAGKTVAASAYETSFDEIGFIFYESAEAADAATVAANGTKVAGEAYGENRFASAYAGVQTSELNTTVYFVAYVAIGDAVVTSDVRSINLYDKTMDAAEDGYFGTPDNGVYVPAKEKAVYRAMIDYYHAYVNLDDVAWDA